MSGRQALNADAGPFRLACACLAWSPSLRLERVEADPAVPSASRLLPPAPLSGPWLLARGSWAVAPGLWG